MAAVLSNWHNVLRAINMASGEVVQWPGTIFYILTQTSVKVPRPDMAEGEKKPDESSESRVPLPHTLVRIPVQQQVESVQSQEDSVKENEL